MAFSQCCARTSAAQVQLPESADDLALSLTSRLASVYAQAKISTLMLKTCEKVGETYQCSISLLPKYLKHSCVGNKRIQIRRVKDVFYLGRHAYNRRRYCQRQRPSKDRLEDRKGFLAKAKAGLVVLRSSETNNRSSSPPAGVWGRVRVSITVSGQTIFPYIQL